ncbi:uncharacterized protein DEA37_0007856 [Paragonimus westermani]|uniref:Deleted in lung and esophageal cancer protein 1 n=1 Tax=Paragonimus westermani TaxID=34504 RepID=A0A5J4NIN7_9TREM|nr:uncharacterized protein DEA37_0007856 [Paragonimus westermani]
MILILAFHFLDVRIDWQIFLDSNTKDDSSLLEFLCFTSPAFERIDVSIEPPVNIRTSLEELEHVSDGEKSLIKVLIRPREGDLLWQSSRARIAPGPSTHLPAFTICPEQLIIPPHQDGSITVTFRPTEVAYMKNTDMPVSLRAHAFGYLTLDNSPECLQQGVERSGSLLTDRLCLNITAQITRPLLQLDLDDSFITNDCNTTTPVGCLNFSAGLGDLLLRSPKEGTLNQRDREDFRLTGAIEPVSWLEQFGESTIYSCSVFILRRIRMRSSNKLPIRVRLVKDADALNFGFLAFENAKAGANVDRHSQLLHTMELTLRPNHPEKVTTAFRLDLKDLPEKCDDPQNASFNHITEGFLKQEAGLQIFAGPTDSEDLKTEFASHYTLRLCAQIARPAVRIFPVTQIDFGTVFVGDVGMSELRVINDSRMRAFWYISLENQDTKLADDSERTLLETQCSGEDTLVSWQTDPNPTTDSDVKPLSSDGVFDVAPRSGLLEALSVDATEHVACVTIRFKPMRSARFEATYRIGGVLGEAEKYIKFFGTGSHDERHRKLVQWK